MGPARGKAAGLGLEPDPLGIALQGDGGLGGSLLGGRLLYRGGGGGRGWLRWSGLGRKRKTFPEELLQRGAAMTRSP